MSLTRITSKEAKNYIPLKVKEEITGIKLLIIQLKK